MGTVSLSIEPYRQSSAGYATPNMPTPLAALQFLLGQWKAISQAGEAEGGFRLTYGLIEPDVLAGKFETASSKAPDQFSPYLVWSARRAK